MMIDDELEFNVHVRSASASIRLRMCYAAAATFSFERGWHAATGRWSYGSSMQKRLATTRLVTDGRIDLDLVLLNECMRLAAAVAA